MTASRAEPPLTSGARVMPPARLLTFGSLLAAAIGVGCLVIALRQPDFRLELTPNTQPQLPPLTAQSRGLHDVTEITGTHGNHVQLHSSDLEDEPDVPFASYTAFDRFLQRQKRLSRILRSGEVHLLGSEGRTLTLHPPPRRPLAHLSWLFWYQFLVGAACWLCGLAIWVFRRDDPAAAYSALSGFGLMLTTASAAVFSTRELALPGATFRALSAVNHFGSMLAIGALIAVFWHYPKRLTRSDIGPWLVTGFVLIWFCDFMQVLPLGNYGVQLVFFGGAMVAFLMALLQWHVTRGNPVERASLQWFLMSWFLGVGIYLALVTIPAIAGFDSGDTERYAFGSLLLIAIGLALGVARYRLFELESWWFRILAFLLGGAMVVLTDVLLTTVLTFNKPVGLAMSLGISGWLYFPARQWLVGRLYTRIRRLRTRDLPALLSDVLSRSVQSPVGLLPEALRQLYSPLSLKPLEQPLAAVTIVDNGLALQVPGISYLPAWEARWADDGRRLFSSYDIEVATAVHVVLDRVAAYQFAVERGVEQERARLTQDLHDDIGARLLTLLHRHSGEIGGEVRDVLERLRLTVHGLGASPLSLAGCADAWHAEAVERCSAVDVALEWVQPENLPKRIFSAVEQVDLSRILREAVSNALVHARPRCLRVEIESGVAGVRISVSNDGVGATVEPHSQGQGLRNMRNRVQRMGGVLEFDLSPPQARVSWSLPVSQPVPG